MDGQPRALLQALMFAVLAALAHSSAGQPSSVEDPAEARVRAILTAQFQRVLAGGRYMRGDCSSPIPDEPAFDELLGPYRARQREIPNGAGRFPIELCSYRLGGFEAVVIMMNPDAEQLVRWAVAGCRESRRVRSGRWDLSQCAAVVARMFWRQAGAQFPISGMVVEPAGRACDNLPGHAQFGFRHGATVAIAGVPAAPGQPVSDPCQDGPRATTVCTQVRLTPEQRRAILTAPVVRTADSAFARLSNLSRLQSGRPAAHQCPLPGEAQPQWLDQTRQGYLEALGSDRYPMLLRWIDSDAALETRFHCRPLGPTLFADC